VSADTWQPFGITDEDFEQAPRRDGVQMVKVAWRANDGSRDRAGKWLRNAMLALAVLAAAAAVVSFQAQYELIASLKHARVIAAVQAGIPDVGAAVFACLGIAMALHGKRAVRARVLNLVCVGISIAMNALAAHGGWRPLAVWVMAPVLYALASDTLIGVIRSWTLARQEALSEALAGDEGGTPLAALGGLALWLLRLSVAPGSTLGGFRRWVVEECPVAPGRRQVAGKSEVKALASGTRIGDPAPRHRRSATRGETKTARFLALVEDRHGPLAGVPVGDVSRISAELAPEVDLNAGAARTALRARVLAAQNGGGE
jgi:hypothetical protein